MSPLSDVCAAMREAMRIRIVGSGSRLSWLPAFDGETISTASLTGVVAHDVDDQVVEVWAGTPVEEVQAALAQRGQCLPLAPDLDRTISQQGGTIGGLLSMNLPHALSAQCGGPRDWTLGMTVVRTDGTTAKSGSKAVKSVAGYDAHKLLIGSRGTLGLIASVILRTYPLRSLPGREVEVLRSEPPRFTARTLRSGFADSCARSGRLVAKDPASCTLWSLDEPQIEGEGWVVSQGGQINRGSAPTKIEDSARSVFDPTAKLAPGWIE